MSKFTEKLRKLDQAATPGEWYRDRHGSIVTAHGDYGPGAIFPQGARKADENVALLRNAIPAIIEALEAAEACIENLWCGVEIYTEKDEIISDRWIRSRVALDATLHGTDLTEDDEEADE